MHSRARLAALATLALLAACNRASKDSSKVLANVGGTKITQADFEVMVTAMLPDPSKAKTLMASPGFQAQKPDLVRQLAMQKAMLVFAKSQGLDKDPAVQHQVESATAQAYFQSIMVRRADPSRTPPSDAQLLGMYDELKAKMKDIPPFEQVKEQLKQGYPQWLFQKELKAAVPVTYAPEIGEPAG